MMISKLTLFFVGVIYSANAFAMWFAPMWWYETVPGITMTGPSNMHFLRDIALVYLVSGVGLLFGAYGEWKTAAIACLWPALHALFHASMFFQRGAPLDTIAAVNVLLIQLPAWSCLWATFNIRKFEMQR